MAEVILENVNKVYDGKVHAIRDANLHIRDREFLVLVGPSGCGKSTLLRMVAGLEEITSGNIYIDGNIVNGLSPKDRDISMVFQNYALYPHMNVYDNMSFGLRIRKYPPDEIEKRINEAAEILGISHLLKRKPRELSGGQRQRVALGRAIVRKPKVFLFDEPLSNLDAKLRVHMRTEIARLHRKLQTTMIYVTHDQVEAMTMGDRIAVLKDGVIQQHDTPLNLYNKPANTFVAGFIGSPAMNFLHAKVIDDNNFLLDDIKIMTSANIKTDENQVILGIRPEHFLIDYNNFHFKAQIEVIEPMGNEIFLHFNISKKHCIARVPATYDVKPGDELPFRIDIENINLFDINSKIRINKN